MGGHKKNLTLKADFILTMAVDVGDWYVGQRNMTRGEATLAALKALELAGQNNIDRAWNEYKREQRELEETS